MADGLIEAYHGVFNSSKEILKNKQRHLYINMLDLLTRTIKALNASAESKELITDEFIKFFCIEILPLVFDADKHIQDNAILAIEVFLSNLDTTALHDIPEWSSIKENIIESHSEQLRSLQQSSNSNWYKIWCQLIRILDKEILKANCINPFLSIVELSFRSNDYQTRSEAFICWKCLIEIFAKHNEISSAKRIKLICIPLKSSQARSLDSAINKFKVWWYFLCKLGAKKIEEHLDITLESFLMFCFGGSSNNQQQQQQQTPHLFTGRPNFYPIVKQMAIACFIEMIGFKTTTTRNGNTGANDYSCREIRHILETKGLELPPPLNDDEESLISINILSKSYKLIIIAAFESTIMILMNGLGTMKFFKILWKSLCEKITKIPQNYDVLCELFEQLSAFLENSPTTEAIKLQCFCEIIEFFGSTHEFPFKLTSKKVLKHDEVATDDEKLCNVLESYIHLLFAHQKYTKSLKKPEEILRNLLNLNRYEVYVRKFWLFQRNLMEILMKLPSSKNEINDFELNFMIWKNVTESIIRYLNNFENQFEFRQNEKNIKILNEWLLRPFNFYNESNENNMECRYNDEFLQIWNNLVVIASTAEGQERFSKGISLKLRAIIDKKKQIPILGDVLDGLISQLDDKFDSASVPVEAFELIKHVIMTKLPLNYKFKMLQSLNSYIKLLGSDQIINAFPEIKSIVSALIRLRIHEKNSNLKCFEDEICRSVQDKLKLNKDAKDKKLLKEFKDLIKKCQNKNDEFVIIPTVWSLNPDKLTEHQKEKMKEKRADIPALYNDISQSQDTNSTSIKPWTPHKIVIAKGKDASSEIAISSENVGDDTNEKQLTGVNGHLGNEILNPPQTESSPSEKPDKRCKSPKKMLSKSATNKRRQSQATTNENSPPGNSESVLKTQRSPIKQKLNGKTSSIRENKRRLSVSVANFDADADGAFDASDDREDEDLQKSLTKNVDQILNTFNIQIENEEKRQKIIKQLKSIKIDTIQGNTVVEGKLRRRSITTARPFCEDDDSAGGNRKKKRAKLSNNKETSDNETLTTAAEAPTTDERSTRAIAKTPTTTTKPARKSLSFEKEKHADAEHLNGDLMETSLKPLPSSEDNLKATTTIAKSTNHEKEKTENDSSLDEVIGSSQQCESAFAKRFALRKSMTPVTTPNRSSPNKKKSDLNKKETTVTTTSAVVENPTVPDLNVAHMPTTTASESRHQAGTKKTTAAIDVPAATITATNDLKTVQDSTTKQNGPTTTMISNGEVDDSVMLLAGQQIPSSSPPKRATNDNVSNISDADTEPLNISLLNRLPSSTTIIKSPLREVHSAFTVNSSQAASVSKSIENVQTNTENRLCELETQLNTENFDSSKENSPITPNKRQHQQQSLLDLSSESPGLSPVICEKLNCSRNVSKSAPNKSMLSSPELLNVEERTTEFLNNTLNISPITMEANKSFADKSNCVDGGTENANPIIGATIMTNNTNDIIKCTSPTGKKLLKSSISLPSSPPDRKPINTVCSPALKPKPMSQLMGRGAQFINMIRNKNNEMTSKQLVHSLSMTNVDQIPTVILQQQFHGQETHQQQQHKLKTNEDSITNAGATIIPVNNMTTPTIASATPNHCHKDLLVFSKTLPPANASPSASILKRKFRKDSCDETAIIESPMMKRKRVSFHDPPVSVTKEYVKHLEESHRSSTASASAEKPHFTRCLMPDNTSTPQNMKKFKRISRADSMVGIAKFTKESPIIEQRQQTSLTNKVANSSANTGPSTSTSVQISTEMDSLKWESVDDTSRRSATAVASSKGKEDSALLQTATSYTLNNDGGNNVADDDDENSLTPSPSLYFPDEQSVLNHVLEKYPIEVLFNKYLNNDQIQNNTKSIRVVMKEISDKMLKNQKLKTQILEILSETHPIEFLDHAIQENLNSTVLHKLNSNSIIEHICEKSKIDSKIRQLLLERVQNLLKLDKLHANYYGFIVNLINDHKLTNDEIINLIQLLVNQKQQNNENLNFSPDRDDTTTLATTSNGNNVASSSSSAAT